MSRLGDACIIMLFSHVATPLCCCKPIYPNPGQNDSGQSDPGQSDPGQNGPKCGNIGQNGSGPNGLSEKNP